MTIRPPANQQMAAPVAYMTPNAPSRIDGYARFMGLLRDIRAEVQNLRNTLNEVIARGEMDDTIVRAQEVVAAMRARQRIYTYNAQMISERLEELRAHINDFTGLYDRYGDEVTHIENYWERVTYDWPPRFNNLPLNPEDTESVIAVVTPATQTSEATPTPEPVTIDESAPPEESTPSMPSDDVLLTAADHILRKADETNKHLDNIVYHAALLTIPGRLNQHLHQLRIGQKLDFDATFADEVPNAADRRKILEYLSARPMVVQSGIIDAANGVIFHASPYRWRRWMSYLNIAAAITIGALMVYVLSNIGTWVEIEGWIIPEGRTTNFMVGYAFVIVGGIVHLGVDAVKQAQNRQVQSLIAVEDWLLWIHIKEMGIIVGIISLWVGFFGLMWLTNPEPISWETAFFVGYSIDSFIDLFLERFNTAVGARNTAIKAQLGLRAASGGGAG